MNPVITVVMKVDVPGLGREIEQTNEMLDDRAGR